MTSQVNVAEIIDNSKIRAFQIGIYVVCFVCLALDGDEGRGARERRTSRSR